MKPALQITPPAPDFARKGFSKSPRVARVETHEMPVAFERLRTLAWFLTFGVFFLLSIAWGNARQEEINREHGDGEA